MDIRWAGQACFQLKIGKNKNKALSLVIDPFSSKIGLKMPSLQADILLVSHNHYDHNNISAVSGNPFVVSEPGQYEVKEIFIEGIPAFHDSEKGSERGEIIMFKIAAEGINIGHLSDLGQKYLTEEQLGKIGNIDILMVPVGGTYTINGAEAKEIISQIKPNIVIPMHYALPGLDIKLNEAADFLKIMGIKEIVAKKKFSAQAKDFSPGAETEIVVLEPQ